MRPTVKALSRHFDVHTFSLRDAARSLDDYVQQVSDTMSGRGIEGAVICGVSFGGLIALRFAATHPSRTRALILASTPGPGFTLRPRHKLYARLPWIFGPLFLIESPWRLRHEIAAALPDRRARWAFRFDMLATLFRAPLSLGAMAGRAVLMTSTDVTPDCCRVASPTLVLTGDAALDYVVPVDGSIAYASLIAGARTAALDRTGHLGMVTKPEAFATAVATFANPQSAIRDRQSECEGHDAA